MKFSTWTGASALYKSMVIVSVLNKPSLVVYVIVISASPVPNVPSVADWETDSTARIAIKAINPNVTPAIVGVPSCTRGGKRVLRFFSRSFR